MKSCGLKVTCTHAAVKTGKCEAGWHRLTMLVFTPGLQESALLLHCHRAQPTVFSPSPQLNFLVFRTCLAGSTVSQGFPVSLILTLADNPILLFSSPQHDKKIPHFYSEVTTNLPLHQLLSGINRQCREKHEEKIRCTVIFKNQLVSRRTEVVGKTHTFTYQTKAFL